MYAANLSVTAARTFNEKCSDCQGSRKIYEVKSMISEWAFLLGEAKTKLFTNIYGIWCKCFNSFIPF